MPSYYSEKHYSPRRHGPPPVGTVVRRVKVREPQWIAPAKGKPTDTPNEPLMIESTEKPAPQPAVPEWSRWESVRYPNCDGYWRAKARGNGTYVVSCSHLPDR